TDRLSAPHMIFAELANDLRTRGVPVAENPGQVCAPAQLFDELRRKARDCCWEIAPIERDRHTCDFPVSRWRVLALGNLPRASVGADGRGGAVQPRRHPAARQSTRLAQAEADELWQRQRSRASSVPVALGSNFGDVADGVGALVAISGCIG